MTNQEWSDRAAMHADGVCDVVVEIPRGSRNKYELDDDGVMWFDRRLGGPLGSRVTMAT